MSNISWTVTVKPGRYSYRKHVAKDVFQTPYFEVGRVEDEQSVGFTWDENAAKWICTAMNVLDAYLREDEPDKKKWLEISSKLLKGQGLEATQSLVPSITDLKS